MSLYRPLAAVDADIISSYGEKPLFKLAGGYAIDFHYRKNDPNKRLGPCRGHRTDCECAQFQEKE